MFFSMSVFEAYETLAPSAGHTFVFIIKFTLLQNKLNKAEKGDIFEENLKYYSFGLYLIRHFNSL